MIKKNERIMIADDQEVVVDILKLCLEEEGYQIETAANGAEAWQKMESMGEGFSLLLTDYDMPEMNGLELVEKVRSRFPDTMIVMLTAHKELSLAINALKKGVYDYINKPFDVEEVRLCVYRTLRHRYLESESKKREKEFDSQESKVVEDLIGQLKNYRQGLLESYGKIIEGFEDRYSFRKGQRDKMLSLAREFSSQVIPNLQDRELFQIALGLYEIGKVGIADEIYSKSGSLSESEMEIVKQYPEKSVEILQPIEFLLNVLPIVESHRERVDGKGYPRGVSGAEIPPMAQLLGILDAYVAMTTDRPYRKKISREEAIAELRRNMGTQFATEIGESFIKFVSQKK